MKINGELASCYLELIKSVYTNLIIGDKRVVAAETESQMKSEDKRLRRTCSLANQFTCAMPRLINHRRDDLGITPQYLCWLTES